MVKAERTSDSDRPRAATAVPAEQDLPSLVARLGDDLVELVDGKLGLLKLDLEEQIRGYARDAVTIVVAGLVATIGVALAATGLAFSLAYLLADRWDPLLVRAVSFASVGTFAVLAGLAVIRRSSSHAPASLDDDG